MTSIDAAASFDDADPAILFDAALGEAELREALDEVERSDDAFEADVRELARRRGR